MRFMLLFVALLMSCHSQKQSAIGKDRNVSAEDLATEKYGDRYKIISNKGGNYSIVRQKTKQFKDLGYDVNYFVFDHSNGAIIIEDSLRLGSVSWVSATQLKAINRKRDANDKSAKETYLFDVVTKLKSVQ